MPNKLASLRASQLTESGLFKGVNALDCPLWSDARNVLFRNGGPEKVGGYTGTVTVSGAGKIRGLDATQDEAAVQRLFFGDATKLYMWVPGNTYTLASGLTGIVNETTTQDATAWSFARFGNWEICTNGVDAVKVWKTGTTAASLTGVTFTKAAIVKQSRGYVLAFNTSNGAGYVEWCSADNPEDWTPTSTNDAGNVQIRDINGPIKAVSSLGEQFLILGKNQAYLLAYVGAPFVWQYQPALTGIGAVGKCAVVEANRIVYGLDDGGFWSTDGVQYQRIGTKALWDWVKGVYDSSQLSKVAATYDASTETVYWSIPTTAGSGEPTVTVGFTISTGSWTVLDFGRSGWVPQLGVYKYPCGAKDGVVYFHNTGTDAGASALTAYVQTKPLDFGEARAWKYLEAIELQLRKLTGSLTLYIGWQADLDDAITWDSGTALDDGFEPIYTQVSGRFLSLKIESSTTGADWAMSGADVWGDVGGTV